MNKVSIFFKRHPLLALFLTSVITILCINTAISVQSKRFGAVPDDMNSWNFGGADSPVPESIPSPEMGESAFPEVVTADLENPNREEPVVGAVEVAETAAPSQGDFVLFDVAESAADPAENAGDVGSFSGTEFAAEDFGALEPSGSDFPADDFSAETLLWDASGADEPDSSSVSSPRPADIAEISPAESVVPEIAVETAKSAAAESAVSAVETVAETVGNLFDTVGRAVANSRPSADPAAGEGAVFSDTAAAEPVSVPAAGIVSETTAGGEPVDFFDVSIAGRGADVIADAEPNRIPAESVSIETVPNRTVAAAGAEEDDLSAAADPSEELTTTDLNWIQTDLTGGGAKPAVTESAADDLGWELLDTSEMVKDDTETYQPHEPDTMVAEQFGSAEEPAASAPAESVNAEVADTVSEPAEPVSAEVADTASEPAEPVSAEVADTVSEPAEPVSTEVADTASEPAGPVSAEVADTASEPAETDAAQTARQCPCAKRPACPQPASSRSTCARKAVDPAPEPVAEPAAAPEKAAAAAPAARKSEVWAVSTENLSGYAVQQNQLLCWRAEGGEFVASSVEEYKATLSADIPTVIMIHGNMTDWPGALRHAQSLKTRIDQMRARQQIRTPYRLVIWKWASERQDQRIRSDSQAKAYLADLNGFYLASFLSAVNGTGCDVTLVGFSFGARSIGGALELMAGGTLYGHTVPENQRYVTGDRYHAILLAGACNYGDFGVRGLYARGGHLLSSMINVFNPVDSALQFYPLLYGAGGPQAIGVAPIDPASADPSFRNRLWSINSSGYGPQHSFDNLLYSICDPLLGNMIYAGKIWSAADAIPAVSDAVVDPEVKQKSEAEAARAEAAEKAAQKEDEKIIAENE